VAARAVGGAFFHFGMAPPTGLVGPILAKTLDLAGALFVALLAALQHFLVHLVREGYLTHGGLELEHFRACSKSGSGESNKGKHGNSGLLHLFISFYLVFYRLFGTLANGKHFIISPFMMFNSAHPMQKSISYRVPTTSQAQISKYNST
jgi:hypothetical protein